VTSSAATHRIAELAAPEVAARLAAGAAVLFPMGSLETHGPQAPMGDFLLAEALADRMAATAAAQGTDALVLPAIPFGGVDYFSCVPGGIVLSPATLQAVVEETCENLIRTGTRRILILNGHAGSIAPVDAAARMLRRRHELLVPAMHLWRIAGSLHAELGGDPASFGHGGDPVWSVALALRPDLCTPGAAREKQAVPPILGLPVANFGTLRVAGVEINIPMEVEEVAPGGVACADSRPGNAAHGARIVARLVEAGAAMLSQLKAAA
jgi:creatinine amidohydrolase